MERFLVVVAVVPTVEPTGIAFVGPLFLKQMLLRRALRQRRFWLGEAGRVVPGDRVGRGRWRRDCMFRSSCQADSKRKVLELQDFAVCKAEWTLGIWHRTLVLHHLGNPYQLWCNLLPIVSELFTARSFEPRFHGFHL